MSNADSGGGGWYFGKVMTQIPLGVWLAIIGQASALIFWAIKLDERVTENQKEVAEIARHVHSMDERDTHAGTLVSARVTNLERRQDYLIRRLFGSEPTTVPLPSVPLLPPPSPSPLWSPDKKN